ncbi:MAG: hypothetical protein JNM25_16845 [Planctomycetes bacterium]|nr:hypothetical protein [Planctomycetota bacterium]
MLRLRLAVTGLLCLGACAAPVGLPQAPIVDLPWGPGEADQQVLAARRLVEQGQPRPALDLVAAVLAAAPRHVDALRLRQDVMRERGRRGRLQYEVDQALAADPDDALLLYLRGRIVGAGEAKLDSFTRAARLRPDSVWPWLGLAHTLRRADPQRAQAIYAALYQATDHHPLVAIAFAALLRDRELYGAAGEIYAALRGDARVPGVGDLGLAQCWLAAERRPEAWTALLAALRERPYDPAVQATLRGWLQTSSGADQVAQAFDLLREDPARLQALATGDGLVLVAELLQRAQQPQAALALLEAKGVSARQPALRRLQRRLLLAIGDVAGFLATVRADVPRWLVDAEPNQLRGRWLLLLDGPWHDGDPLAAAAPCVDLVTALLRVGWLIEAEQLAEVARRRWPDQDAALATLRDEARGELAFEAGVRRLLYQGYQTGDRASLDEVVQRLRELSARVFGRDVVGEPTRFSLPMIGEMLDPFTGGLAAHLDRYNRHFVLGRRAGGTAEGMLLTRLSLRELPAADDLPLAGRCFEVVAMDRDVRALAGVLGGDIAGVALLNHFLVDFDAVREWSEGIAARRRVVAEDGFALRSDPLPIVGDGDPLDVAWHLCLASPVADRDLDAAVLDTIRQHERQHLVDAFHYLPIESNLWRSLGLLFAFGLSPSAIEAELERRAELASLATSAHTELVLAHIADFLAEPESQSPHHQGFGALGRELGLELRALGVPAELAVPSRWHLVDRELVRQAARRLLANL